MLDILELAADSFKEKLPPGEELNREACCQALLDRLKQRNQVNEAMIIKFIRRNTKKRVKSKLTLPIMQALSLHQADFSLSEEMKAKRPSSSCLLPLQQATPEEAFSVQEVKPCKLKTTSKTMQEKEPFILSTPHKNAHADTLHILQHVQLQGNKKFSRNETPSTQAAPRGLNSFTKYLRNFFISKLNQNSRLKEQELEMRMKARKSYHGRVQTEVQTELKQKIKVKSLVFGQSEVVCKREGCSVTDSPNQVRLHTQIHEEIQRYGKNQQKHKGEKAALPAIHNSLAARNKRCLQNYIRLHQDQSKREKPLDFRTVKLPTEADLYYNQNAGSRRCVGRLDVLHVRKM